MSGPDRQSPEDEENKRKGFQRASLARTRELSRACAARGPHGQVAQLNSAEPSRSLNYRREAAEVDGGGGGCGGGTEGEDRSRLSSIDLLTVARAS